MEEKKTIYAIDNLFLLAIFWQSLFVFVARQTTFVKLRNFVSYEKCDAKKLFASSTLEGRWDFPNVFRKQEKKNRLMNCMNKHSNLARDLFNRITQRDLYYFLKSLCRGFRPISMRKDSCKMFCFMSKMIRNFTLIEDISLTTTNLIADISCPTSAMAMNFLKASSVILITKNLIFFFSYFIY